MSEKVTFQELVDSIAKETKHSRKFTYDFLKGFVDVIQDGLKNSSKVNIAGFGKFDLQKVDEREGYNPQSGEKITIPEHHKVVFKPYKSLREQVNAPFSDQETELIPKKKEKDSGSPNEKTVTASDDDTSAIPKKEGNSSEQEHISGKTSSTFKLEKKSLAAKDTNTEENKSKEHKSEDEDTDVVEFKPTETEAMREFIASKKNEDLTKASGEKNSAMSNSNQKDLRKNKKSTKFWVVAAAAVILLAAAGGAWYFNLLPETEILNKDLIELASFTKALSVNDSHSVENKSAMKQAESSKGTIKEITIRKGQTLWGIALKTYENARLWPWIYDTNNQLENPNLIKIGNKLAVPLPSTKNGLTSSDSIAVAKGYIATYEWYKDRGYSHATEYLRVAKKYHQNIYDIVNSRVDKTDLAFANRRL